MTRKSGDAFQVSAVCSGVDMPENKAAKSGIPFFQSRNPGECWPVRGKQADYGLREAFGNRPIVAMPETLKRGKDLGPVFETGRRVFSSGGFFQGAASGEGSTWRENDGGEKE